MSILPLSRQLRRVLMLAAMCGVTWTATVPLAFATQINPPSAEALIERSALIAEAVVMEVDDTAFDPQANEARTLVIFEVQEVLKGEKPQQLEFMLPGGLEPDGTRLIYEGAPTFVEGEKYLLFVTGSEWSITPFVGWSYGALRENKVNGEDVLTTADGVAVTAFGERGWELGKKISENAQELHNRAVGGRAQSESKKAPLSAAAHRALDGTAVANAADEGLAAVENAAPRASLVASLRSAIAARGGARKAAAASTVIHSRPRLNTVNTSPEVNP